MAEARMKVNLIYFTDNGCFHSEAMYESEKEQVWEVFEQVQRLYNEGCLPGLIDGLRLITLVDQVEHKDSHAHLILGYKEIKERKRI
jgi:hypothetical protein